MNVEGAREFVATFRSLAEHANTIQGSRYYQDPNWLEVDAQLQARLLATDEIVAAIEPSLHDGLEPNRGMHETVWAQAVITCTRALGILAHQDEVAAILAPQGPMLSAGRFHEWVWKAAAALWDDGHRREAIQAAATIIDIQVCAKLGLAGGNGVGLAGDVWSDKAPTALGPRLRPQGFTPGTADFESALSGARFFHMGCMARIRNLSTHTTAQPDEQEALEQLAALSVLARWIDDATVETV